MAKRDGSPANSPSPPKRRGEDGESDGTGPKLPGRGVKPEERKDPKKPSTTRGGQPRQPESPAGH